jgi:nucleoside phosphorylase
MASKLVVCAPLRIEARALRASLDRCVVQRTGYGLRRSARSVAKLAQRSFDAMAIVGVAGGLGESVCSGDVVVASEIRGPRGTVRCQRAAVLAGELRRLGLTAHCGPIVTADHLVGGAERAELGRAGALAVDRESAALAAAAVDRPLAVVRVVVDTAREPLLHVTTPRRALAALRRLHGVGVALDRWARSVLPEGNNRFGLPKEVC